MNLSHRARVLLASLATLLCQPPAGADGPDPVALLEAAYLAQIPEAAQYSRIHITSLDPQPGGGSKTWDALVLRKRYADGARTAITLQAPDKIRGLCILTGPRPENAGQGLWLYAPEDRRARLITPLEPDDYLLQTKLNYDDLALTFRRTQPPRLIGKTEEHGRTVWKVEARPLRDRFYSRIVTWVADDNRLPVKREYFDRTGKLWKVASYHHADISGEPTVIAIELNDVQSRVESVWKMEAVAYSDQRMDPRRLAPSALGRLMQDPAWQQLAPVPQPDEQTTNESTDDRRQRPAG